MQGYQVMADDVDGELRLTVHYVSPEAGTGSEREQEFWPMVPEIVGMLSENGVEINRELLAGSAFLGGIPSRTAGVEGLRGRPIGSFPGCLPVGMRQGWYLLSV